LKGASRNLFEWFEECAKKPTREEQAKCLEGFADELDRFIEEGFKILNPENIEKGAGERGQKREGFLSKLRKVFSK